MARPKSLKPAYCHHKPSGRAYVTLDSQRIYLGRFGTQESRDAYDRVIGEWIAKGRQSVPAPSVAPAADMKVSSLLAAFWVWAKGYYVTPVYGPDGEPLVDPDGKPVTEPAGELSNYARVIKLLRRLYGPTRGADFGPLAMKAVMEEMAHAGWCRNAVNRQAARVKAIFKWGVSQELVPASVYHGLLAVRGFRKGKSAARETAPVGPVPMERVEAVLQHVSPQVGAIIRLQLLTGARGGELFVMRTRDIDTSATSAETRAGCPQCKPGAPCPMHSHWVYRPLSHKTAHHGHTREIYLGPQAQEILRPFLKTDLAAYVFSPAEAEAARQAARREKRTTKVQPSQVKRAELARKRARRRPPKARYDRHAYQRAIVRGCEKAFGMPKAFQWSAKDTPEQRKEKARLRADWRAANCWHAHQLRHAAATRLRREFGIEVARVILGHRSAAVTAVYAEADMQKAAAVMGRVG